MKEGIRMRVHGGELGRREGQDETRLTMWMPA